MKKLLSTLLSMAIFATLTTPAFAERELTIDDGPLWNDLVSYFNLNGDVVDQTGNTSPQIFDNNGAFTDAVTFQAGKVGQAAVYNNSNSLGARIGLPGVTLGGGPASPVSFEGDITIAMWIKSTDPTQGSTRLFSDWNSGERNIMWVVNVADGRMYSTSGRTGGASNNGIPYTALPAYTDYSVPGWFQLPQTAVQGGAGTVPNRSKVPGLLEGDWVHVVYQRDGNTLRNFINGVEATYYTDNNWTTTRAASDIEGLTGFTTDHDVAIGGALEHHGSTAAGTPSEAGQHSGSTFDGFIDDVAIWDTALATTEILQIYNMGVSPVDADTEYTGTGTTDFESETNMTSVPSVILNKADGSGVAFSTLTPMNAENKDYDDNVKMGPGYITVNSTANPELDRAATVTMNVNTCNNLAIYKDDNFIEDSGSYPSIKDRIMAEGTECTIGNSCLTTAPTCSGNTATFYVTGFSSFAGGGSGGGSVPEFSDYMLMLTFLIAGFAVYRKMPELQKIVGKK